MPFVKSKSFDSAISYFPPDLHKILSDAVGDKIDELCEIRLRAGKPMVAVFVDGKRFFTSAGRLSAFLTDDCVSLGRELIEHIFNSMCAYSVHSHSASISSGFITLENGNRVGVYGMAAVENGKIISVRNISGLNIRISGDFPFVSMPIVKRLFADGCRNTLICGAPASGKTTALRRIARYLSDERELTVAVVDERCEIGTSSVGINTDVLSAYPKSAGIELAVRTLSPDVIICDEIGAGETSSILTALNCGVKVIMSMHCRSFDELFLKPQFCELKKVQAVDCCLLMDRYLITDVTEMGNKGENICSCSVGNSVCSGGAVCEFTA